MKVYKTGFGKENEVNWFQYHVCRPILKFLAYAFKMNISIGDGHVWGARNKPRSMTPEEIVEWNKKHGFQSSKSF